MRDDLGAVWRDVQHHLRASVTESTYRLWFDPLRPLSARGPTLFVSGPAHVLRWVEKRYAELVRAALIEAESGLREVDFVSAPSPAQPSQTPASEPAAGVTLNPAYTFERFVIGPGNRLAHAAALAVAEAPGQAYNPLFLYGPPGLGKTHLLGAIATYLHAHNPDLDVHYTTAERFTNEFVSSLQGTSGAIGSFKDRYRRADVLLIDDIQFLQGKARTGDEFFHTFNSLYEGGAQLVLTADRLPSELSQLAQRLRDRFEWGLIAPLQPPDLPTRLVFLTNLARERRDEINPDVLRAIAARGVANLRLLEGALTRVQALASLTASALDPDVVARALPDSPGTQAGAPIEVTEIQRAVAARFDLPADDLLSASRTAEVTSARHLAMYLTRRLTDLSLPAIARAFNRRDHTTVLHAMKRVETKVPRDPQLARALEELTSALRATAIDRDRTD